MLEHGHVGNGQNQHCGKVFLKKSVSMTSFKSLQYFYLRLLPIDIIDWEGPCLLLFLYNETEGVKVKTAIFRFWKSNETGRSLGGREGGGLGNVKPLWNGLHMFLQQMEIIKGWTFQSQNKTIQRIIEMWNQQKLLKKVSIQLYWSRSHRNIVKQCIYYN